MSITVAILVTDEQKETVEAVINALTPEYTIGFARKCAAIDPEMSWQAAPTHWYTNASGVPDDVAAAWQSAATNLTGVILFVAINAENPLNWAHSNLASQGLQFVPNEPI